MMVESSSSTVGNEVEAMGLGQAIYTNPAQGEKDKGQLAKGQTRNKSKRRNRNK